MGKATFLVEACRDADYASHKSDRKSVSGGVLMVAGIIVASQTMAEVLGTIELLKEIGIMPYTSSVLNVDNQAAIAQIEGEGISGRAKYIDVRYKFIKHLVKKEVFKIEYCAIDKYMNSSETIWNCALEAVSPFRTIVQRKGFQLIKYYASDLKTTYRRSYYRRGCQVKIDVMTDGTVNEKRFPHRCDSTRRELSLVKIIVISDGSLDRETLSTTRTTMPGDMSQQMVYETDELVLSQVSTPASQIWKLIQ
ncbi:Retrotransposon protein [Phytophthora cinnamomi]|uniref:Retrotransposon protein n=1 Tax=Phytophthora cinnamomi TaxID=4785 RepID=UPI003559D732|nr:Retrotransposon protein [Phytophthora cinnamomi]